MNHFRILLLACFLVPMLFNLSPAQEKPIQLALFDPVQIVPATESVSGFRFSLLYGRNVNMKGFDLGLATKTTGSFLGVQWGLVGLVDGDGEGWQHNMVSITNGAFSGLQSGFFSSAGHIHGLQFSFVNNTGTIKGIQIGLINIIREGGFMPVFPIVNWGGL